MGFAADPLVLSVEVRAELERRVRAHRDVRRARAVLLCADGMSLRQIGIEIGMDQHKVGEWRKRFLTDGLDGLNDRARPGRPRRFGHDDRMKLAALATSEKHDDDPVPMWTYHELADVLFNDGIEISPSQIVDVQVIHRGRGVLFK
jgi:transposase